MISDSEFRTEAHRKNPFFTSLMKRRQHKWQLIVLFSTECPSMGMALAQYVTAMAYSNVGLGIAHSMAHTLGAVYDTPHGVACAMHAANSEWGACTNAKRIPGALFFKGVPGILFVYSSSHKSKGRFQ